MQSKVCKLGNTSTVHVGRRSKIYSAEGVRARFGSDLPSVPIVRGAEERSATNEPQYFVLIEELPMLFAIGHTKLEQIVSNEDFWIPSANIIASYQPQILRPVSNSVKINKKIWNFNQTQVRVAVDLKDPREFSLELRMAGIFEPEQKTILRGSGFLHEQNTGALAGSIESFRSANGPGSSDMLCLQTPCLFFEAAITLNQEKISCKRLLWSSSHHSNQLHYAAIALDSGSSLLLSILVAPPAYPFLDHHQRLAIHLKRVSFLTNLEAEAEYHRYCSSEFYDNLFSKPILHRAENNYRFNLSCPSKKFQQSIRSNKLDSADGLAVQHDTLRTHKGSATKTQDFLYGLSSDRPQQLFSSDILEPVEEFDDSQSPQKKLELSQQSNATINITKKLQKTLNQASLEQELAILTERKLFSKKEIELLKQVLFGVNHLRSVCNSKTDCMVLQEAFRKLEPDTQPNIIDEIFELGIESMAEVSCSIYGNFLMQIVISKLSSEQRIVMLYSLVPKFELIACHPKGIFCLQFFIEQLQSSKEIDVLLQCIIPSITRTVKNPQAGFVFKKAVQSLDEAFSFRLWQLLRRNLADICCDKYGICVVKFIISKFEKSFDCFKVVTKDFNKMMNKCKLNSHFNFGVQHLIEVVNKQGWVLEEMEEMIASYFCEENRLKIRSVSVAHTVVLILSYHRKSFIDSLLNHQWTSQFSKPLTPQETRIFKKVEDSNPKLKPYVKILKMAANIQNKMAYETTGPYHQLSQGFANL